MGADRIPYDQTNPMMDAGPPADMGQLPPPGAGPDQGSLLTTGEPNLQAQQADMITNTAPTFSPPGPGAPDLGSLGGAGVNSDQLTGDQLAQMGSTPEDIEVEQLSAALQDPNTPPQQQAMIQQMLDLAARRRLAGIPSTGGLGA